MNQRLPTAALTIRPASFNDIPFIQAVVKATWPVAYNHIIGEKQVAYMLDLIYSTKALHKQIEKHHLFFLALQNFDVVGFAAIHFVKETLCRLEKLYVLPTLQKTGAGRKLLETVEEIARSKGATTMQLNVNRQNIAKSFYEKYSYTIVQEVDTDIENGFFMNDFIMEKGL